MRGSRLKPRVTINAVADKYASAGERIVEVSFCDGSGALISLRQPTTERRSRIEVYKTDGQVRVSGPEEEVARQYAIDRGALDYEVECA